MKTNCAISNISRRAWRRALLGVSLSLIGSAALFTQAASLDPSESGGRWDCTYSGKGQKGITFLTFTTIAGDSLNTWRITGYEIPGKTAEKLRPPFDPRGTGNRGDTNTPSTHIGNDFRFCEIDGYWGYDYKGNIVGYLNLTNLTLGSATGRVYSVSFSGKVSGLPGKRKMSLVGDSPDGKRTYRGLEYTNIYGSTLETNWYGIKKQARQFYQEFFTLTSGPDANYPTLLRMTGYGSGYTIEEGFCMVSRQGKIAFDCKEVPVDYLYGYPRTSFGSFNKKSYSASTKGAIYPYMYGDAIFYQAYKY